MIPGRGDGGETLDCQTAPHPVTFAHADAAHALALLTTTLMHAAAWADPVTLTLQGRFDGTATGDATGLVGAGQALQRADFGIRIDSLVQGAPSGVPEPATAALVMLASGVAAAVRRR